MELMYDRINEYSAVTIKLASPEESRSWSYGEVKKPETINYRTYRPEKDGLFCERICSLLAMKTSQLERVIYYQDYIVTEVRSKKCPLKEKQLLTEEQFREARERYREDFEADMGAAAIRTLLQKVDLKSLSD